jgi:hypothetical protein
LRPQFSTIVDEVHGPNGQCIVKWSGFDAADGPKKERSANARLIAAAPDLLVLAQGYAAGCAECNGTGVPEFGDHAGRDCPDCADIRAVIAKATQP